MGVVKASDMTVEDARLEQQENLRLIHTAYTAIRARFPEKRIVLAGHSMGAFLTLGYLAENGNTFDRVVAMAGRVDLPLDFVRRFAIGQNFIFDHVGDVSRYEETREVRGCTSLVLIYELLTVRMQKAPYLLQLACPDIRSFWKTRIYQTCFIYIQQEMSRSVD